MLRAAREQVKAKRTWFVTLTFNAKSRAASLTEASLMSAKRSQSERLCSASGWYVTTFMKRLRNAGLEVRYMWVSEPHGDGFPHWHGLIHDQRGSTTVKPVFKKKKGVYVQVSVCPEIESAWSAGWIDSELVRDSGAIRYVTKYIAKGRFARIRASLGYGLDDLEEASVSEACTVSAVAPDREASI